MMDKTPTRTVMPIKRLHVPIYGLIAPLVLILALLACAGTPLGGTARYICPTAVPLPTTVVLVGTPTPTPRPQPTPYVIQPPADFFIGDAVFIGSSQTAQGVRLRLQNVISQPASDAPDGTARSISSWELEVNNIGTEDYEVFPSVQSYLSAVRSTAGDETGIWPATREAADEINRAFDADVYRLSPGQTELFRLSAYHPAGQALRFAFQLDPTVSEGGSLVTWINQSNPYCTGDIAAP